MIYGSLANVSEAPMKHRRFFITYATLALIGAVIFLAGHRTVLQAPEPLRPLARLKIPKKPTLYLPGVYESPQKNTSILGAQTIDPRDIITYVNKERMKRGTPPLRVNDTLMKAAQMRADVILKYQNFSHQDPYEHIQLDSVLPKLGYTFSYASENIGMGDDSAKAFVNGFMSSPPHKANLLNPDLKETGVAIATGLYKQYYTTIAVQLFTIPAKKEDYLGYSSKDIDEYKRLLSTIQKQLVTTRDYINRNVPNKEYYEGWETILIRQQEIIVLLIDAMRSEEPFVQDLISRIKEYNQNLNRFPKQLQSHTLHRLTISSLTTNTSMYW